MTTIHIPLANNTYSESLEVFFNKHHEDFNKIIDKIRDAVNNSGLKSEACNSICQK